MEIAFVSSNRMLAEMDKEKNGLCQRLLSRFYNHPNGFVSTMLVGNNIALVIYGILFARLFDNTLFAGLDDGGRVTADTILSTLIVLFTGEFYLQSDSLSVLCGIVAYQQVQYFSEQVSAPSARYEDGERRGR